jgi:hypothetical protein
LVDTRNFVSVPAANRRVTLTLLQTGPVTAGPWLIAGDSIALFTDTNGACIFSNLLEGGYRLDIAGNPSRSFPLGFPSLPALALAGVGTNGTVNAASLIGATNTSPYFYTANQVDALLAASSSSLTNGQTDVTLSLTANSAGPWLTNAAQGTITNGQTNVTLGLVSNSAPALFYNAGLSQNTNFVLVGGSLSNAANGTFGYAGQTAPSQLWGYQGSTHSVRYSCPYWTNGLGWAVVYDVNQSITANGFSYIFDATNDWSLGQSGWAGPLPCWPEQLYLPPYLWSSLNPPVGQGAAPTIFNWGYIGSISGPVTIAGGLTPYAALLVTNGYIAAPQILIVSNNFGISSTPSYMLGIQFENTLLPNVGLGGESGSGSQGYWCGDLMLWGNATSPTSTNYNIGGLDFFDYSLYNPNFPNADCRRSFIRPRSYDLTGTNGGSLYFAVTTGAAASYAYGLFLDHYAHAVIGPKGFPFEADAVSTLEVWGATTTQGLTNNGVAQFNGPVYAGNSVAASNVTTATLTGATNGGPPLTITLNPAALGSGCSVTLDANASLLAGTLTLKTLTGASVNGDLTLWTNTFKTPFPTIPHVLIGGAGSLPPNGMYWEVYNTTTTNFCVRENGGDVNSGQTNQVTYIIAQ